MSTEHFKELNKAYQLEGIVGALKHDWAKTVERGYVSKAAKVSLKAAGIGLASLVLAYTGASAVEALATQQTFPEAVQNASSFKSAFAGASMGSLTVKYVLRQLFPPFNVF